MFNPDPARKLSANLYDIYYYCVYSEKLLMMDRGNVRNAQSFLHIWLVLLYEVIYMLLEFLGTRQG